MRTALVIRHVAFEDAGILIDVLPRFDYQLQFVEAGRDILSEQDIQSADLLIVLGGPISANDEADYPFLTVLRQAIGQRLQKRMPTLGICLGAQIIARALGSRVYPSGSKEIGWSTLQLTAAGRQSCLRHLENIQVLHWHGEMFDVPEAAAHLAATTVCENQAFSVDHYLLALQFHPEVASAADLECWYIGHTLELAQAGVDLTRLRQDSQQNAPRLRTAAQTLFTEWLTQL